MITLAERLETDYKTAMKAQDRLRIETIRLVKAAIQRVAIDKRKDAPDDQEILQVLAQQVKQRRETVEAAKQATRQDVLTQATEELAILNAYLPPQLSEGALATLIDEAIQAVGTNYGQIMKHVMAKAAGAADGAVVSRLVRDRLSPRPAS
ncbi:MAG: GatB/YqeY domain-containing protein [Candidatus Omnitrophota bacterium]|nr:GatB/YqeY domain-containing protein [Candidatus Omnitrophota bacterium]